MKLFAVYSPAIEEMWQNFRRSVIDKTSFELCCEEIPREFDGASYGQPKYYKLLKWLVEYRVMLAKRETDIFAFAGADTEFFSDPVPDLTARITDKDMIGADDLPDQVLSGCRGNGRMCSCLYVVRPGPQITALFERVAADPAIGYDVDDPILNRHRDMVQWDVLPHNMYWNPATWFTPRRVWTMNDPIPKPPKEMKWFHANWCSGADCKAKLLKTVHEAHYAEMV